MATTATAPKNNTDVHGIERVNVDDPGFLDKLRNKWGWFDHMMRMQERFASMGGNQYAAGITYFSVLSLFPLLMLVFAVVAFVLVNNPATLTDIQTKITESLDGGMAETVNKILDTAIDQRGAIAGIGGVTALWSGLSWMNHLRYGASKMWRVDPTAGGFVMKKVKDLIGLIGLMLALVIAFGITAIGASGLTAHLIRMMGLENIPGIHVLTTVTAIVVGLIANYLVFLWLMVYLPRTKVPVVVAVKAAVIGAVAVEVLKQLGSFFFSKALNNPAGATFGPIIGVMVLLYFVWRIVLYTSAWAATSDAALKNATVPAPAPAVIRVRTEIADLPGRRKKVTLFSIGAALGAAAAAAATLVIPGPSGKKN